MINFWDERYKETEYAYGKEPNEFIKETLDNLNIKGKALFPAEGEGRNAVYAAKLGLDVVAFDTSVEGKNKALSLATENNVTINYLTGSFDDLQIVPNSFDFVVLNFAHFPPNLVSQYHKKCVEYLKNGGYIILEAFSKEHFELNSKNPALGGPKDIEMLFSEEQLKQDFKDLETIKLSTEKVTLSEGLYHNGLSSVVRYIGKK